MHVIIDFLYFRSSFTSDDGKVTLTGDANDVEKMVHIMLTEMRSDVNVAPSTSEFEAKLLSETFDTNSHASNSKSLIGSFSADEESNEISKATKVRKRFSSVSESLSHDNTPESPKDPSFVEKTPPSTTTETRPMAFEPTSSRGPALTNSNPHRSKSLSMPSSSNEETSDAASVTESQNDAISMHYGKLFIFSCSKRCYYH